MTTIDSPNRIRDAERIKQEHPLLTEQGRNDVIIRSKSSNEILATGYTRVVYGDHGPYIELDKLQIEWNSFPIYKKKSQYAWYDEYYTKDKTVMLYDQKKDVKGLKNPPKGAYSSNNNRTNGYADYIVGMYYLSPDVIITERT